MNLRPRFFASLIAFALPLVASAATINIDFYSSSSTTVHDGETWNRVQNSAITTPLALLDSTGASTGISISSTVSMQHTGHNTNPTFPGVPKAVSDSLIYTDSATPPTFTFSGLDSNYTYTFTIYAVRQDGSATPSNRTSTYTVAGDNNHSIVHNATNGDTPLVFLDITPDSNGSITLTLTRHTDNNNSFYAQMNGLKIEATQVIPEPSSFAVIAGIGAVCCVTLRRRRSAK